MQCFHQSAVRMMAKQFNSSALTYLCIRVWGLHAVDRAENVRSPIITAPEAADYLSGLELREHLANFIVRGSITRPCPTMPSDDSDTLLRHKRVCSTCSDTVTCTVLSEDKFKKTHHPWFAICVLQHVLFIMISL